MLGRSNLADDSQQWREDLWSVGAPKLLTTPALVQVRSRVALEPARAGNGEPCFSLTAAVSLGCPHVLLMFRPECDGEPDVVQLPSVEDRALVADLPRVAMPEHLLGSPCGPAPYAWISLHASSGTPVSNAICLGRCEDHSLVTEPAFELPARLSLWMSLRSLDRSGARLRLSGVLTLAEGAAVTLALGADLDRFGNPGGAAAGCTFPLIRPGVTVEIPRQVVRSGAPGNLWVSLMLRGTWGGAVGEEIPVGLCTNQS